MKFLDYIRNTGVESYHQYINTGFKPNNNTHVIMGVKDTGRSGYWFGAWNYSYNSGAYALCNDQNGIYSGYDGQGGTQGSYVSGDAVVELDKNVAKINGSVHRTFYTSTFQVNYPLFLFGQNRSGSYGISNYRNSEFSLEYCKIYDNDILVRDFVPAMDDNDNIGLFDLVNSQFYPNAGSGSFTYGSVISGYKPNGSAIITLANYQSGGNDSISWVADTPADTSVTVSASVNNGTFRTCTNGGLIPSMVAVGNTCNLRIKAELATEDTTKTPSVSQIKITSDNDKKVIVLGINAPNFSPAVGNITVKYDGNGALAGYGGPAEAFDGVFNPTKVWKGNQNDEEHIETLLSANVVLKRIIYHDTKSSDENIGVSMSSNITLTDIHDL